MAVTFRLNVTPANIPLLSMWHGRSLIKPEATDSNYITSNAYGGLSSDRDVGVPSPLYMHNVMPTIFGLTSVSYKQVSNAASLKAKSTGVLRTCTELRYPFLATESGNYVLDNGSWRTIGGFSNPKHVTFAHIHKATYICHAYSFVQKLNETTNMLEVVELKGLNSVDILGVTHANNYLIAYTADTIHWSSSLDSTDFVPQLATLAGSIIPLHVRGAIVGCRPTRDGFIIFTTVNMVKATFSGDPEFPFRFMEIVGSGGVTSLDHVSADNNSDAYYCWTNKGIQAAPKTGEEVANLFPEVTDFLTGHVFEDYIGDTTKQPSTNESEVWSSQTQSWPDTPEGYNELKQYTFTGTMQVRVALVANRFLVVSYGIPSSPTLTHAVVYDISMKRWGKLRTPHMECFELDPATQTSYLVEPNHSMAFLATNGVVSTLDLETATTDTDSVIFFGKLQGTRSRITTLHSIEVESTLPKKATLSVLTSLDGKNFNPAIYPMRQIDTKHLSVWLMRTTGINHSFKLTGTFDISSMQGTMTLGGDR